MKELSRDEMVALLQTVNDGVLALTDGVHPYCIPFGFVWVDESVCLSMFPSGKKWDCLQKNSHVCFTAFSWNEQHTEWASIVIDGQMHMVKDLKTIEAVVKANMLKRGLNPETYLEKRIEYYRNSIDNPKALKIFIIKATEMQGRKMHTLLRE